MVTWVWETMIPYIYGAVSILIIVLLYIAYGIYKLKKMIKKEIESEY